LTDSLHVGTLNGHSVGRILKEAVRRATVVIRTERLSFEARTKMTYDGLPNDVVTNADIKAQEVYVRTLTECFPDCGILGEEDDLAQQPKPGFSAYFTVDPLDGTKAFTRRQSHGVATMIALVDQGVVLSAYVGDVNADEVYGYRPGSNRVHRISHLDSFEELAPAGADQRPMARRTALLRGPLDRYSAASADLVAKFETYEAMGSSIGTWAARLWKSEVGALFLAPGWETPWDSTPVVGISRKLGYDFYRPAGRGWETYDPGLPKEKAKRDHDMLIIPPSLMEGLG
jgi:fructose-1,6-bisphosphatase/inositol monophosphatase family enzyme